MKILSLYAYYTPERAASLYLSENHNEAFAKAGFTMVLYTPIPTRGITNDVRNLYKKQKRHESFYDGRLLVHRFSIYGEGKNPILRALRYFLCCIAHLYKGLRAKDIDVIFVASTPPIQGAMAALLKKIKKVPFIYNLQDIFPDSLTGTGLTRKGSLIWEIGRVIENFTYRNADKIIVISEDFKKNIMEKGVPEDKIEVIYNWVDESAVVNIKRENNKLFERYNLDTSKFFITYCGNIGLTQNMDMLLDVAKELEDNADIHFVLVGEGAYKKTVNNQINERNIKNITLLPLQPYEDISHVFSLGDIGLVISKPGVGENSLPSKTWSIMSAERPVLANFDKNELQDTINNNNFGIFTEAGDKDAFKRAIMYLYENPAEREKMGLNGRKFIIKNLTKEIGTKKYVDVIKKFQSRI